MPISTTLKCKGLYSFPNKLGTLPEGALVQADNVVINRNDVIEPRRGFSIYSSNEMADVAKQLFFYKTRILRHYGTTVEFDNGTGTFTGLTGSFTAPVSTDGKTRRIKSVEANGNFYFTTSEGIKKISLFDASGYTANLVTNAGGVNALDTEVTLNNGLGFFTQDSTVSYRVVWGLKDANNNLILGSPSGRAIITNPIQDLLIKDFNNLLSTLDSVAGKSSADLLSDTDYVASLKLPTFALESNIKSNLTALCTKLDNDFTLTDVGTPITLSSFTIANGVVSLKFSADVSSYLKADDVIELSNLTPSTTPNLVGVHLLTSVSTDTVAFVVPNSDVTPAVSLTTGKCKRIKYTVGKFRTNSNADITTPIVGVKSLNGKVFVRFSSDISAQVSTKDVIVVSGMSGDYADLNGSQIVKGVIASTALTKDTIVFESARSDSDTSFNAAISIATEAVITAQSHGLSDWDAIKLSTSGTLPTGLSVGVTYYVKKVDDNSFKLSSTASPTTTLVTTSGTQSGTHTVTALKKENNSIDVTNGSVSVVGYQRQLTLSDTVTTAQLEDLQNYYDDIVNELQLEPTGIINASLINQFYGNNSTKSATVNVKFNIPASVTQSNLYQVYRTTLSTSTGVSNLSLLEPGDEHRLVYESNPTADDLAKGYITVHDISPESFLGANLYTNPASGEGLTQANDIPPIAQDLALFKGYTFYANTQTKFRKKLSLSAVTAFKTAITEKITNINYSNTTITLTFQNSIASYDVQVGDAINLYDFTISSLSTNKDAINSCFRVTAVGSNTISFRRAVSTFTNETDPKNMGSIELIKVNKTFTIANGTSSEVYTFQPETHEFRTVTTVADNSNSLAGKYFTINSANDITSYYVWYKVGGTGTDPALSGKTGIQININTNESAANVASKTNDVLKGKADFTCLLSSNILYIENANPGATTASTVGTSGFTISTIDGYGEDGTAHTVIISTAATPGQQVDETANSLIRVVNKYPNGLVYAQYLSSSTDVPGQMNFEARTLGGAAFYFNVSTSSISDQFSPVLPNDPNNKSQIATNEVSPNRIYYSKYQQPEAVPLLNYIDVGPKDKAILRILALRDSLFIFKEDAIYRLSGEVAPFIVALFDSSANLSAIDTAAVLNNNIYMASNQGVSRVSETGVQVISRPIEDLIVRLNDSLFPYFSTASFGLGYESDRSYYLFTVDSVTDQYTSICYRYNIFTDTWSVFNLSKTCAVIHPTQDKMYLGASDVKHIESERKTFDRSDYADREYSHEIIPYALSGNKLTLYISTINNFSVGDSIVQKQYLTIKQFNRLLKKLDSDAGLTKKDYYSTLAATQGDNLRDKVTALAVKLDTDTGLDPANKFADSIAGYGQTFANTQSAFNVIINKLNADFGAKSPNYQRSEGTVAYELDITDINLTTKVMTLRYAYPLIVGPITIYKSIQSVIVWAPDTLTQPSIGKHVREGSIMFENTSFTSGIAAFSTDLNPAFIETPISGSGNGTFGSGNYGSKIYGGSGNSAPFRTYIPRSSQRCRHVNVGFWHSIAREKYAIFGKSLVFELTSERMYFR